MPTYRNDTDITWIMADATAAPGELLETVKILSVDGLVKISDEPYYPLTIDTHVVDFGTAETIEVPDTGDLLRAGVIRIKAGVDVMIKPNSDSNPFGYLISSGEERDFLNDRTIETLFLESTGSGQVTVFELSK